MTEFHTVSFQAGDATITVRESLGIDILDVQVVYSKLSYDRKSDVERNRASNFAYSVLRSTVSGSLGFEWVSANSSAEALDAAFVHYCQLSTSTLAQWWNALAEANKTPPKAASTSSTPSSPSSTDSSSASTIPTSA